MKTPIKLFIILGIVLIVITSSQNQVKKETARDFYTASTCNSERIEDRDNEGFAVTPACYYYTYSVKQCSSYYAYIEQYRVPYGEPGGIPLNNYFYIYDAYSGDFCEDSNPSIAATCRILYECASGLRTFPGYPKCAAGDYGYDQCPGGRCVANYVNGISECVIDCTLPWGGTLYSGNSVTAYLASSGTTCTSQPRTCNNGVLSGSYTFASCTVNPSCPVVGDTYPACDGIKRAELGAVAQQWLSTPSDTALRTNLGIAAQNWIANGGPA